MESLINEVMKLLTGWHPSQLSLHFQVIRLQYFNHSILDPFPSKTMTSYMDDLYNQLNIKQNMGRLPFSNSDHQPATV